MTKFPPYGALRSLPGVGPKIADDYRRLGIDDAAAVAAADPEELYERIERLDGPTDRCMLYVFRCARYGARPPAGPALSARLTSRIHLLRGGSRPTRRTRGMR